jgi:hypothetical protein
MQRMQRHLKATACAALLAGRKACPARGGSVQAIAYFIPSARSTPSSATAFPSFFVTTPNEPE